MKSKIVNKPKNKAALGTILAGAQVGASLIGMGISAINDKRRREQEAQVAEQMRRQNVMNDWLGTKGGSYDANIPVFEQGGNIPMDDIKGQTHEEGGTNMGGLVEAEKGETKVDNYIYSDDIIVTKKMASEYEMPSNYVGKTMAEVSKILKSKYGKRTNDAMDSGVLNEELGILTEAQEEVRQSKLDAAMNTIQAINPEMANRLKQPLVEQQTQEELQNMQGTEIPKYAGGGIVIDPAQRERERLAALNATSAYGRLSTNKDILINEDSKLKEAVVTGNSKSGMQIDPLINELKKNAPSNLISNKEGIMQKSIIPNYALNSSAENNSNDTDLGSLLNSGASSGTSGGGNIEIPEKIDYANLAIQNMGNLYDIGRGIRGLLKPDINLGRVRAAKIDAALVDPQSAIQDVNTAYNSAVDTVRQNSQSAGSYLSNRLALASENAKEVARTRGQYDITNVSAINQARMQNVQQGQQAQSINLQQSNNEEDINQRERDVASNMIQKGLSNAGEIYGGMISDIEKRRMDTYALRYLGTKDYHFSNGNLVRNDGAGSVAYGG